MCSEWNKADAKPLDRFQSGRLLVVLMVICVSWGMALTDERVAKTGSGAECGCMWMRQRNRWKGEIQEQRHWWRVV